MQQTLPVLENPFSQRINAIIGKVREARRGPYYVRPALSATPSPLPDLVLTRSPTPAAPLRRQGGRRAFTPAVGAEPPDRGPRGPAPVVPPVARAVEGQGALCFRFRSRSRARKLMRWLWGAGERQVVLMNSFPEVVKEARDGRSGRSGQVFFSSLMSAKRGGGGRL